MNYYQDNGWMDELIAATDEHDMVWPAPGALTYKEQQAQRIARATAEATFASPIKMSSASSSHALTRSQASSDHTRALQALANDGDQQSLRLLRRRQQQHTDVQAPTTDEMSGDEERTGEEENDRVAEETGNVFFGAAHQSFQAELEDYTEGNFKILWNSGRLATSNGLDVMLKDSRVLFKNETFGGKRVTVTQAFLYVMNTKFSTMELKREYNHSLVDLFERLRDEPEGKTIIDAAKRCNDSEDSQMGFIRFFTSNSLVMACVPQHLRQDNVDIYWPLLLPAMFFSLDAERAALRKQYKNDLRSVGNDGTYGVIHTSCTMSIVSCVQSTY